jgi:hypothetical protein
MGSRAIYPTVYSFAAKLGHYCGPQVAVQDEQLSSFDVMLDGNRDDCGPSARSPVAGVIVVPAEGADRAVRMFTLIDCSPSSSLKLHVVDADAHSRASRVPAG